MAAIHEQVQQAIEKGDLVRANSLAYGIPKALQEETARRAPTSNDTLLQAETTWRAGANLEPARRIYYLLFLPDIALKASDFTKALYYANLLLDAAKQVPDSKAYDEAIFEANTTLGQIFVRQNDIGHAKQALIDASAAFRPSSRISGLRFDLAQMLLDQGERDAVISFLQRSAVLPRANAKRNSELVAAINGGAKPTLSEWR